MSVHTIDTFSVYWSNEQNEIDEVDKIDELDEIDELSEVESPNSSWMKYLIFKMWSTSFIHQCEVVHKWTTHRYFLGHNCLKANETPLLASADASWKPPYKDHV